MSVTIKSDLHGEALVDFGREKPHYRALERVITGYYADLLGRLNKLRLKVFGSLPRVPNEKQEEEDEIFTVTTGQLRAVEAAIDGFLAELAGVDRTPAGFVAVAGDGVIQQRNLFAYAVGVGRAADQMGASASIQADRNSAATERMLTDAFQRLSENGRLRLEGIRDDVHEVLANGMQAGLSPVEVGRQLTALFDEYGDYNFQRLARTESAYASITGQVDQYGALGVERVGFLVGADACEICRGYEGKEDAMEGDLPPWH